MWVIYKHNLSFQLFPSKHFSYIVATRMYNSQRSSRAYCPRYYPFRLEVHSNNPVSICVWGQFIWLLDSIVIGTIFKSQFHKWTSTRGNWVLIRRNELFLIVSELCRKYYKAQSIAFPYDGNWIGRHCTRNCFRVALILNVALRGWF